MKYHNILWLFSTLCVAALATADSGDIYQGCIWVEPGINTLYTFNDTFHYSLKVQWHDNHTQMVYDIYLEASELMDIETREF